MLSAESWGSVLANEIPLAAAATVSNSGGGVGVPRHDASSRIVKSNLRKGALVHPADRDRVASLMTSSRPDGFVCASDRTAAILMHTLIAQHMRIPHDVRMVGIDDVSYAGFLPVPLTTLRQPCREIGAAAVAALRERVARPDLAPRDILLHGALVIRESCGGARM